MKSIKKIITTIAVLLITTSIFAQIAQTSDYEIHLQKGKEYENQKKWIYALGEYYDALDSIFADIKNEDIYKLVELNQIPDFQEALESYKNLAEKIENENPGYGEFDDFTLLDNWILLLKEFEKYWTENSPQRVYFGKPERTALNRENRTATYEIAVYFGTTRKFSEILSLVKTGLKKTNPSDWNENLTEWPNVSAYDNNTQKEDDNMVQDGIHFARERYEVVPFNRKPYYEVGKKSVAIIKNGVFGIKFNIIDLNGNVLLKSDRYTMGFCANTSLRAPKDVFGRVSGGNLVKYIFTDVPQQTINLIDSDEINIVLDSAYLKYGTINDELISYSDENWLKENQTWIKNLSEIELDANKIPCFTWKGHKFLHGAINPYIENDDYLLTKIQSYEKAVKELKAKLKTEEKKKQKEEEELAKIEKMFREGVPSIYEILPYTSSDEYFNAGCLDFRGKDCGIWFAPINFLGKINQDESTWKKVLFYTDHLGSEALPISDFYNPGIFTIRIWNPENLKAGKYKIVVRTRNHGDNKKEKSTIELVYNNMFTIY